MLVYAFDDADPAKRDRARDVISADDPPLVISAQVLGEFFVVATRKLETPLDPVHAAAVVGELMRLPVVPIDGDLAGAAIATSQAAQLSYWDALVVEAAAGAGCDTLLTEDLADGATIRSVRVQNPFA